MCIEIIAFVFVMIYEGSRRGIVTNGKKERRSGERDVCTDMSSCPPFNKIQHN